MSFRAVREGVGVFASKARSGPTPLRSVFVGCAGPDCHAFGVPQRGTAYQPGVEPRVGQSRNRCVLKERRITLRSSIEAS